MTSRFAPVLFLTALSGCLSGTAPDNDLVAARARWEASAASRQAYMVQQHVTCFCVQEVTRAKHIAARAGSILTLTYADTGEPVPAALWNTVRTIDALFDEIAEAIEAGAVQVRVTYDATLGYPREVYIDRNAAIADEEIGWTTRFLSVK